MEAYSWTNKGGLDRTPIFYTTLFRKTHIEPGRSSVAETKTNYCNNVHFMAAERFSNDVLEMLRIEACFKKALDAFFEGVSTMFSKRDLKIFTKRVQNFFYGKFFEDVYKRVYEKAYEKFFEVRFEGVFGKGFEEFYEKLLKDFFKCFL